MESPASCQVWALAPSGKRLAEVSARSDAAQLRFTADVGGDKASGARMVYEVAVK